MSCFFCDHIGHISLECDVYKSDESRKSVVSSKMYCQNCLKFMGVPNLKCLNCEIYQKCYFCFTKGHQTLYCPDRFEGPHFFPPSIDQDLMPRFMKLLDRIDKFYLGFSYPNIVDLTAVKPLKVYYKEIQSFKTPNYFKSMDFDIIVRKHLNICFVENIGLFPSPLNMIFNITHLELTNCSPFPATEFLQLLSPKTKILKCVFTKISPNLNFRDILTKAPKLEDIDICQTDFRVDSSSWPNDLLQLNVAENLCNVRFSVADLNFSIESLAKLMKKTSSNSLKIYLRISLPWKSDLKKVVEAAKKVLLNSSIPLKYSVKQSIYITFKKGNEFDAFLI